MIPLWLVKYRRQLIAAAALGGAAYLGWQVEHWRMGKEVAALRLDNTRSALARQTALTERGQAAMADALQAVLGMRKGLTAARERNRALLAAQAAQVPTGPEYACRDLPLPTPYLETFK